MVIVHLMASAILLVVAVPLVLGKVKMNAWYGVRTPAAFASEGAWSELNRCGGRRLLALGFVWGVTAGVGAFLGREEWVAYDWTALAIVIGGLTVVIAGIYRHAREPR